MSRASKVLEKKYSYVVKHNTYASAVQEAIAYAESQGYSLDDNDTFKKIGMGNPKPSKGKTNRITLPLYKDGTKQRVALHLQVFNNDTDYGAFELNLYIS